MSTLYGLLVRLPCSGGRHNGALCCVDYFLFWSMRAYLRFYQTSSLWREYQAVSDLREERQMLQATQMTLHGMLSSVFASAECDVDGVVGKCSKHLSHLLGGRDMSITSFCDLGATGEEVKRLSKFMHHAAENAMHRAVTIQSSIKCVDDIIDVKLFAIHLPTRSGQCQRLFIGLQEAADEASSSLHGAAADFETAGHDSVHFIGRNRADEVYRSTEYRLAQQASGRCEYTCTPPNPVLPAILERGSNALDHGSTSSSIAGSARSLYMRRARKNIHRRSSMPSVDATNDAHNGPVRSSPFLTSDGYLRECSLALLEDLVASWNFIRPSY